MQPIYPPGGVSEFNQRECINRSISGGRERRERFPHPFLFCAWNQDGSRTAGMRTETLPNDALAELAGVLGEDNVRTLVRTYLHDFPKLFGELSGGERKNRHRVAHSLKSSCRLMGALALSRRMAELEVRLAAADGPDVGLDDLAAIRAEFQAFEPPLRKFAGL
jgi:hypothetical protein